METETMDGNAVRFALAAIYAALTSATSIATGKPVDRMADQFVRGLLDANAPPEALELLVGLTQDDSAASLVAH